MQKVDLIVGLILCIVGLFFLLIVIPDQTQERNLGIVGALAPSFVPNISVGIMTGLSVLLVISSLCKKPNKEDESPITIENWIYISIISVLLSLSFASFVFFGFIPGGIITVASFMLYMGRRDPIGILLTSSLATGLIYIFFWYGLNIELPAGMIEWN